MRIIDVEQNTKEWLDARLGIPTASAFSRIVTTTGKLSEQLSGYAAELAAEKYSGTQCDGFDGNYWTDRGHELEPMAVDEYGFMNGCEPKQVGFCVADDGSFGFSPDRLVGDGGILEVKALRTKNHVLKFHAFTTTGKIPIDYFQQTQGQLLGSGREWVDLFYFHPDLPSFTVRILPDKSFHEKLLEGISKANDLRDEYCLSLGGDDEKPEPQPEKFEMEL